VIQTSKLPGKSSFLMISSLNSFLAIKLHILIYGHHLLNSWIQFPTTDLGMMIRWCPLIFFVFPKESDQRDRLNGLA
jgi:hypothetical protein